VVAWALAAPAREASRRRSARGVPNRESDSAATRRATRRAEF
jgi:hypothetical protein